MLKALKAAKEAQNKKKVGAKKEPVQVVNEPQEFWTTRNINVIKHSDITIEKPAVCTIFI